MKRKETQVIRSRVVSCLLVLASVAAGLTPAVAAGLPAAGVPAGRPVPGATVDRITLITGDVAELTRYPDGRRSARLVEAGRNYFFGEFGGDVHLVPAVAYPHLAAGQLDPRLFNLSYLVAHGFQDRSSSELPLLLTAPDGSGRRTPTSPVNARVRLTLPSVAAVAVSTAKQRAAQFWESLRAGRSRGVFGHGIGKVWLDGRVRAHLDRAVGQIGAPSAWRAGYDGRGVKVAVLDTGYDAGHPGLARRVVGSRSFVPDQAVQDRFGHGTHVASIVAGTGAGGGDHRTGRRIGAAPGARLLVVKVLDNEGSGLDSWIIAGMEWAVAQGAKVVSLSLGGAPTDGKDPLSQAVDELSTRSGALFVISAGNSGDEETVGSPGSATSALTVGAVDDRDRLAWFSSRGPRLGDGALKPEVTAPGVGIVAARASGTDIGRAVSPLYTSMDGTSMAAPLVAGAAAILAQRHPGWRGSRLKATLAATARPRAAVPVPAQGLGRIDIAAALRPRVSTDSAAVSFGDLAWSGKPPAPVIRKVAYRNDSRAAVTLDLRLAVASPNGVRPRLAVAPARLRIAPGATAVATLTLDQAGTQAGSYSGVLTARGAGAAIRTGIGFKAGGKLHDVTVTGITREGRPALAPSGVQLWNTDTGHVTSIAFDDSGRRTIDVPTGRYAVMGFVMSQDEQGFDKSVTLLGVPDVWIGTSRQFTFDARHAEPVSISTPRRADPETFIYAWHRRIGDRTALSGWFLFGQTTTEVYAQRFDRVRNGTFKVLQRWDLAQPQLTVDVAGPGGFRLPTPDHGGSTVRYVGSERLRLVNAGDGTPADYASAGARGAVALIRWRDYEHTAEQVRAAAEAGVKLLLIYRDEPGFWSDTQNGEVPTYTLLQAEGRRLVGLLGTRAVTVQLSGVPDSTYRYELMLAEQQIRGPLRYDLGRMRTASVSTDFHVHEGWQQLHFDERQAFTPGISVAFPIARWVTAPLIRTDYVTTSGTTWVDRTAAGEWNETGFEYGVPRVYRPGERAGRDWWAAIARPAVPAITGGEADGLPVARFEDAIRVAVPQHVNGDRTVYGWSDDRGDRTTLVLRRNGIEVGRTDWSVGQFPVAAPTADYQLEMDVMRSPSTWATTSTTTHTRWRFRSGHVNRRTVLPLLQVDYALRTDQGNAVPAGGGNWLILRPGYQPGARGPGGIRTTAEISWDGGHSWHALRASPTPVPYPDQWTLAATRSAGAVAVKLPPAPPGATFADLRVTATDRAANQIIQSIHHAWHIHP